MPTQYRLPIQPAGAHDVNDVLAIQRAQDQVAYFAAGVPVFTHAAADRVGQRLAAVQLVALDLADATTLARALGLDRSTIFRCQRKVRAAGVSGLVDARPGPKAPHKLTAARQAQVQDQLAQGASLRAAARAVGVSESALRHARRRGALRPRGAAAPAGPPAPAPPAGTGPGQRSAQDAARPGGVAVAREVARALAATGQLPAAVP